MEAIIHALHHLLALALGQLAVAIMPILLAEAGANFLARHQLNLDIDSSTIYLRAIAIGHLRQLTGRHQRGQVILYLLDRLRR